MEMKVTRATRYEDLPQLLTPAEVCIVMGLGRSTIYKMFESGEIPSVRIGRQIRVPKSGLPRIVRLNTEDFKLNHNGVF